MGTAQRRPQALLNILGVEVGNYPRVLAALSESDWCDAVAKWSALAQPATPGQKAKEAVFARGAAVLKTTGKRVGEQVVASPHFAESVDWFGAWDVQF